MDNLPHYKIAIEPELNSVRNQIEFHLNSVLVHGLVWWRINDDKAYYFGFNEIDIFNSAFSKLCDKTKCKWVHGNEIMVYREYEIVDGKIHGKLDSNKL